MHGDSSHDYAMLFELAEPVFFLERMVKIGGQTTEFTIDIDVVE